MVKTNQFPAVASAAAKSSLVTHHITIWSEGKVGTKRGNADGRSQRIGLSGGTRGRRRPLTADDGGSSSKNLKG